MLKIIVMLDSRRVNKYYIGKFATKEAYIVKLINIKEFTIIIKAKQNGRQSELKSVWSFVHYSFKENFRNLSVFI